MTEKIIDLPIQPTNAEYFIDTTDPAVQSAMQAVAERGKATLGTILRHDLDVADITGITIDKE